MTQNEKIATVFGGTGFLGRQIVRLLAKTGMTVKVVTRVPEHAYFLKPCGTVGQIVPIPCAYSAEDIDAAVKGSDWVINCVGILFEKGKRRTFRRAHVDTPAMIADSCARHGVKRFIHISALGIEKSKSKYAASKREGEQTVLARFPYVTILRPSVMFGEGDDFFNMFAGMSLILPFLPLIGGGHTKFQPVYVGDVAQAAMASLSLSDADDHDPRGKIFELGGPEIVTFRQILERLAHYTGRKRMLVSMPFGIAKIKASFLRVLPKPPLTPDQVESLKTDSVVSHAALTLNDLGVTATPMDLILPHYLGLYRSGGRFAANEAA